MRCNQCRLPQAEYYRKLDEYLCEECAEYEYKQIEIQEALDEPPL